MSVKFNLFGEPIPFNSAVALARTIDAAVAVESEVVAAPSVRHLAGVALSSKDSAVEAPVAQFNSHGEEIGDSEWDRETWLAWYESEFAGYQRERQDDLVEDDAGENDERQKLLDEGWPLEDVDRWCPGPIRVPKEQLAAERDTLRWLKRSGGNKKVRFQRDGRWVTRNLPGTRRDDELLREGPDGRAVVIGAHPFSKEEGSAEWLQRMRLQLRDEYVRAAKAKNDRACKAIVAREAALRARHNARCFARSIATYLQLDEAEVLSVLDVRVKTEDIGWAWLEKAMRTVFASLEDHHFDASRAWDAEFDPKWSDDEKDEWVDRMPVAPQHPTQLVASVKKLRRFREVPRSNSLPAKSKVKPLPAKFKRRSVQLPAPRHRDAFVQATAEHRARLASERPWVPVGVLRFWARETQAEWYDVVKEWQRAELIDFSSFTPQPLPIGSCDHSVVESCAVCGIGDYTAQRRLRTPA